MTASSQQTMIDAANELIKIPKPNSDSHEILYERAIHFGRKAVEIFGSAEKPKLSDMESLVSEIGSLTFDQHELDREYLLIAYKLTSFGNLLNSFIIGTMRDREALSDDYHANRAEIKELTEAVSKLNLYIEEEIKFAKRDSKLLKAAGAAKINLFIFSIPMQSVFDLVRAAKNELKRSDRANIRYVSALLTNASAIARQYWNETKRLLSAVPERVRSFAVSVNLQTSSLASRATNLVIKSRIRRFKPRKSEFTKESQAFELANKRDMLIEYLIEFRSWEPNSVDAIFSSALYLLIMSGRTFFPYSEEVVGDIAQDLVNLHSESIDIVHKYICIKAEAVIDALSKAIRDIELSKDIAGGLFPEM